MGMDVYGLKPKTSLGEYFRNNIWYWHPLWEYCCSIDQTLYDRVPGAHTNSGDGLDAAGSRQLAFKLQEEIKSGRAQEYVRLYEENRQSLPKDPCDFCDENGQRQWHQENGETYFKECNVCNSTKLVDSWQACYPMSLENIQEFTNFLMDCGGFQIC